MERLLNAISIKGLFVAVIAMVVLDMVVGIGLTIALGGFPDAERMTEQELDAAAKALALSTNFLLGSVIFGTLTTVVGGFIVARFGKTAPYLNAAVFGVLGILIGMLLGADLPLWVNVIGYVTVIPAALFGAYLATRGSQGNA